jgi:hypothetical protein
MELLWEFHAGAADPLESDQTTLRSLFPGDSSAQFAKVVRSYVFAEDLDLIREVGEMTNPELFKNEVNCFHGRNLRHKNWLRTRLRIRVSGGRLLKLKHRILP